MILEWLGRGKGGEIETVHTAIAKLEIVRRIRAIVVAACSEKEGSLGHISDVVTVIDAYFLNWEKFTVAFPLPCEEHVSMSRAEEIDPAAVKKREHSSHLQHVVIDFLHDLMSGSYNTFLATTIQTPQQVHAWEGPETPAAH